jgi:hypothetical protein
MSRIVEFVVILDDGVRKLIAMKQREAMFSILLYSWKSKPLAFLRGTENE